MRTVVVALAILTLVSINVFPQQNDPVEPPMDEFYSLIIYQNNAYDSASEKQITITDLIYVLVNNEEKVMTVGIDFSGDGQITDEEVSVMPIDYVLVDNGVASTAENSEGNFIFYYRKQNSSYNLLISLHGESDFIGVPMRFENP